MLICGGNVTIIITTYFNVSHSYETRVYYAEYKEIVIKQSDIIPKSCRHQNIIIGHLSKRI